MMRFGDMSRRGRPYAKDTAVVRFGGRYLMYFSLPPFLPEWKPEGAGDGWSIGIAESHDLSHWTKIGEVGPEPNAPCEQNGLCAPGAICVEGRVHLFYQTYGNGPLDAICHASSGDGLHFTRSAGNPIFRPVGDWNNGRAIDADVVFDGNRYLLYCATRDPEGKIQMTLGAEAAPGAFPDAWTQIDTDGPALRPELLWEEDCIEAPALCVRPGRVYLFYAGAYNNAPQQIGCAESVDGGKSWQRLWVDAPFLPCGSSGDWNSSESGHPFVFSDDDGQTYLFYQGNNDGGKTWLLSFVKIAWDADGRPQISR